jgi:hypothetical protein
VSYNLTLYQIAVLHCAVGEKSHVGECEFHLGQRLGNIHTAATLYKNGNKNQKPFSLAKLIFDV